MLNKFLLSGVLLTSSFAVFSPANAMDIDGREKDPLCTAKSPAKDSKKDRYKLDASEFTLLGIKYLSLKAEQLVDCCHTFDPELSYLKLGISNREKIVPFSGKEGIFNTQIGSFSFAFKRVEPDKSFNRKEFNFSSGCTLETSKVNGEFQFRFTYLRDAFNSPSLERRPVLVAPLSYVLTLKNL